MKWFEEIQFKNIWVEGLKESCEDIIFLQNYKVVQKFIISILSLFDIFIWFFPKVSINILCTIQKFDIYL